MSKATVIRTLIIALVLSAAAPLLSACNTTAGAGQDLSAGGAAVTRGAQDVKQKM